jgi:hypothetical protein
MRKYCNGENIDLEVLSHVQVLSSSEDEEMVFMCSVWLCIYVYLYEWMCASLESAQLDDFYSYSRVYPL